MVYTAPFKGNPFTEVQFTASFHTKDTTVTVSGFYDGNDQFVIRFMPFLAGTWYYETHSNLPALDGKNGSFKSEKDSSQRGMVRVSGAHNFKYANGSYFYPVGTTAYAWNHMETGIQKLTLSSLRQSGFNKLRFCVFPKNYNLVKEEPRIYPFPKTSGGWDLQRFDTEFFRILEAQIDSLNALGIQADLILFHPYDKGRWGFDALPMEVNLRYLDYLIARLGAFQNIWWSLANEWDYVKARSQDDWVRLAEHIAEKDPYGHLLSIHGSTATYFNYWLPCFTHVSVQDEAPVRNWGAAALLRQIYKKPVVLDEVGYEGNLSSRWGRYSGQEMNHLMWMGLIGGVYVTHGEAYMFRDATDTIFWAKGGVFKGSSWKRAAFIRQVLQACPAPPEPADISRDLQTASCGGNQYLIYFGKEIQDSWTFNIPAKNGSFASPKQGGKYRVEILDTWEMTVRPVNEVFELGDQQDYRFFDKDHKKIRLPLQPYLAVRITEIPQ
ncbi:DUF5605 domain-containing protein [Niabella terrae]